MFIGQLMTRCGVILNSLELRFFLSEVLQTGLQEMQHRMRAVQSREADLLCVWKSGLQVHVRGEGGQTCRSEQTAHVRSLPQVPLGSPVLNEFDLELGW